MNVEPDSATRVSPGDEVATTTAQGFGPDPEHSPLLVGLADELPEGSPRVAARAPGRLDVMGGLAEYTGAVVLHMATENHACVVVQQRQDDTISIKLSARRDGDNGTPLTVATRELYGSDGTPVTAAEMAGVLPGGASPNVVCALGAVVELARELGIGPSQVAVSVVLGSTLGGLSDVGHHAAVASATAVATASLWEAALEPEQFAHLCQRVENEWLQAPVGVADAACALSGRPSALLEIHCNTGTIGGDIPLPDNLTFIGIDSGVLNDNAMAKYRQVRTAAFMGRALIDRIVQHENARELSWDGFLARVAVNDYVERFRDRLPTKLKGREFLDRFGETGDPWTRVEPDFTYKVRSRTEHHIYEHARACQFAECLARAIRSGDERALQGAGGLMNASHWSYGQRCGLGSVESDLLVKLVRKHGAKTGVYGAKVSGRGCGGLVTVLLRSSQQATGSVESALSEYEAKTQCKPTIIRGSSQGALVVSPHRF
ncbi:MAG: hypothetical protein PVI86_07715 [Phycisphaerae bacterium]|jgi:L-arabinokinase